MAVVLQLDVCGFTTMSSSMQPLEVSWREMIR
jgi:hypothetical protein